ncbi:MAG: hypothetical protein ACT4OT_07220 [Acidobacteriota bacterium]
MSADREFLFDLNRVADHPQFNLTQACLPPSLIFSQPRSIRWRVWYIDNNFNQIVAGHHTAVTPMTLNLLRLVTCGAKVIYDFQDCFSKQFGRYVASVTEL